MLPLDVERSPPRLSTALKDIEFKFRLESAVAGRHTAKFHLDSQFFSYFRNDARARPHREID